MLTAGPTYSRWSDLASQPGIVVNASVLTGRTQFQALQKQFSDGQSHHIDRILAEYSEADRDAVMRTLHWAIKVGLLALVAAQSSTPTAAKAVSD